MVEVKSLMNSLRSLDFDFRMAKEEVVELMGCCDLLAAMGV